MNKLREKFFHPRNPLQSFTLNGTAVGINLLNFWQWSYSNVMYGTIRGDLAEFIVGSAILSDKSKETDYKIRKDGDVVDFWLDHNFWIEVKSSSYIQSWEHEKLSKIKFDIRPRQGYDFENHIPIKETARHAHLYIFALLKHKDSETVDPLCIDQWSFYVLRTEKINEIFGEKQTATLNQIEEAGAVEVSFDELKYTCHREFQKIGS